MSPRLSTRFSEPGKHPYDGVNWVKRPVRITNPQTGMVVFEQADVEVPDFWSDTSTQILAQKYFRGQLGTPERESSLRQVVDRVVDTITAAGIANGYFDAEEAEVFSHELKALLIHQQAAFNSPVWFNVGVAGRPQQVSACFLLDVEDTLPDILNWYVEEGLIFQGGSGAGVNLSKIRGSQEGLSGGGRSSGPVSFMRGADASAGSIASGGATRRAAKMVILNADHPDIEEFIWCKAHEEKKIRALMDAGFDMGVDGRDIVSVQYQNANNSVRVTDEFMSAVVDDGDWHLVARTTGKVVKTLKARDLFRQMAQAAWECADPGVLFDTTINRWHTLADTSRIDTTNPCGEYHSVVNSSCNLASVNVLSFLSEDGVFDAEGFAAACKVVFLAQEICISFADYPTEKIAETTRKYRQVGLGYANLGATLMAMGVPYDSNEGRAFAAALTSAMTATAYAESARIAERVGPFPGYSENARSMSRVLDMHYEAALTEAQEGRPYSKLTAEVGSKVRSNVQALQAIGLEAWQRAVEGCRSHGVRNSQATVIAPTGTIALLMGCDTTGIEPAFALTSHKQLVGGGSMVFAVGQVGRGLRELGYGDEAIRIIEDWVAKHGTIVGAPGFDPRHIGVFSTAVGDNALDAMAHITMIAAVQPFLSGAVSKTSNLPADVTVEDIEAFTLEAWKLGLKALAIYRDGSKAYQPLSVGDGMAVGNGKDTELVVPTVVGTPSRERLPKHRKAETYSFSVAGCEGYFTVGMYDDGRPGELFMKVSKQGSTLSGIMDGFAIAISLGLQYGVPIESYVAKYINMSFAPAGMTNDDEVKIAASILDFVFRKLAIRFMSYEDRAAMGILSVPERMQSASGIKTVDIAEPKMAPSTNGKIERDLPICGTCGHFMRPNGACYVCEGCGSTSGCS